MTCRRSFRTAVLCELKQGTQHGCLSHEPCSHVALCHVCRAAHVVFHRRAVRTALYEPEQVPRYAYFITSGIASVVTPMLDGGTVEVDVLGYEDLVRSFHLLGSAPVPTSCFMQMAGTGLRIELPELRQAFRASDEIHARILELVRIRH